MATPSVRLPQIDRAGPDRLHDALCRLLGGHRNRADRFLEHARQSGLALDELWCATDEPGVIVATVLAVPNPGRAAMVFMSPTTAADVDLHATLLDRACASIAGNGVALAQALLPVDAADERAAFRAGGFQDLAVLGSMERPMPRRRETTVPALPDDVTIETWDRRDRATMISLLDATYEETLDCPGLCGLRRTEDILDGHLHSGRPEPTLWSILRRGGQPVGALLLSPTIHDSVELVYLGLAREARGQGLGRLLLHTGLASLTGRPERTVGLAVDESNPPALELYRSVGFRTTLRRLAMIRSLSRG